MFLRRFQRRKNGKTHGYWALVESFRTAKGSRQRVVSYLGELKESEQSGWAQLSTTLSGSNGGAPNANHPAALKQLALFDPPSPIDDSMAALAALPILVDLQGVRLESVRDFGDVWLAWGLWRLLGLDELLQRVMRDGRE
jgi:hypothetical protein